MSPAGIRILLDENVPQAVAAWLSEARPDWSINHTHEVGLNGRPDADILEWAQAHCAVIVTFDEDLADRRSRPVGGHSGVIRLRVWPTTIEETQAALSRLLAAVTDADIPGSLIIVDQHAIRVRHPQS